MGRTLLLVTGAGRSGTSTAAGVLHHLGLHVPGPYLKANASNPRGFYESRWSVELHNRLLRRAGVSIADGRPEARGLMAQAVREDEHARVRGWVDEVTAGHPVTVLKDPRTAWTLDLWSQVAAEAGVEPAFLVMLRHPAQVLASRATHYGKQAATMGETGFAVRNLAGWVNAMLMTEQGTRGRPRVFLRYDDLLADWRTAMARTCADLGVGIDADLADHTAAHPVDDFVDPALSRHPTVWPGTDLPEDLRAVAERVWEACTGLADTHGADPQAEHHLDETSAEYARMYREAQQLAHDSTQARVTAARAEAARKARREEPRPSSTPATSRTRAGAGLRRLRGAVRRVGRSARRRSR